jgi:biopolymer transport protein ExbD
VEFRRPRRVRSSLDLTPLIDVVFQMLIFFLLSSSFLAPAMKLKLPRARTLDPTHQEDLVLSADAEGNLRLGADSVELEELEDVLRTRLETAEEKRLSFRGDRSLHYEVFVQVMEAARRAGVRDLDVRHEVPGREDR